jgi:hypothetical protein
VEYDDDVLIMEQMKVFYCSEVVVYLKSRNVLLIQGPYAFFTQKINSLQNVKRYGKLFFPYIKKLSYGATAGTWCKVFIISTR